MNPKNSSRLLVFSGEYFRALDSFLKTEDVQSALSYLRDNALNHDHQGLIQAEREARQDLVRFFSKDVFRDVCSKCEGFCCGEGRLRRFWFPMPLFNVEEGLFVLLFEEEGFLPRPDWDYLKRCLDSSKNRCIFLGASGCLLGDKRPYLCLKYGCQKLGYLAQHIPTGLWTNLYEDMILSLKKYEESYFELRTFWEKELMTIPGVAESFYFLQEKWEKLEKDALGRILLEPEAIEYS